MTREKPSALKGAIVAYCNICLHPLMFSRRLTKFCHACGNVIDESDITLEKPVFQPKTALPPSIQELYVTDFVATLGHLLRIGTTGIHHLGFKLSRYKLTEIKKIKSKVRKNDAELVLKLGFTNKELLKAQNALSVLTITE